MKANNILLMNTSEKVSSISDQNDNIIQPTVSQPSQTEIKENDTITLFQDGKNVEKSVITDDVNLSGTQPKELVGENHQNIALSNNECYSEVLPKVSDKYLSQEQQQNTKSKESDEKQMFFTSKNYWACSDSNKYSQEDKSTPLNNDHSLDSFLDDYQSFLDSDDDLDREEKELRSLVQASTFRINAIEKKLKQNHYHMDQTTMPFEIFCDSSAEKFEKKYNDYQDHIKYSLQKPYTRNNSKLDCIYENVQVESKVKESKCNEKKLKPRPNNLLREKKHVNFKFINDKYEKKDDQINLSIPEQLNYKSKYDESRQPLIDRIESLKEECIRALGKDRFSHAYNVLKCQLETKIGGDIHSITETKSKLGDVGNLYQKKIDNLLYMEEAL